MDAGLAGGQGLGERLRRVVRLAVGEDDDDVGVAGAVAVVGVEHLRADGADGGRRVGRAARVAQVEGVQQGPCGRVLVQVYAHLKQEHTFYYYFHFHVADANK